MAHIELIKSPIVFLDYHDNNSIPSVINIGFKMYSWEGSELGGGGLRDTIGKI